MEINNSSLLLLGLQTYSNPQYFNCYQIVPATITDNYLNSIMENIKNQHVLKLFLVIHENTKYPSDFDSDPKISIIKWNEWTGLHASFLSSYLEDKTFNLILFDAVILSTVSLKSDQVGIVLNKSGFCIRGKIDLGDYYINFTGSFDFIIQKLYSAKKEFAKISGYLLCNYPDYSRKYNYLSLPTYKKLHVYDLDTPDETKNEIVNDENTQPDFNTFFKERQEELQKVIASKITYLEFDIKKIMVQKIKEFDSTLKVATTKSSSRVEELILEKLLKFDELFKNHSEITSLQQTINKQEFSEYFKQYSDQTTVTVNEFIKDNSTVISEKFEKFFTQQTIQYNKKFDNLYESQKNIILERQQRFDKLFLEQEKLHKNNAEKYKLLFANQDKVITEQTNKFEEQTEQFNINIESEKIKMRQAYNKIEEENKLFQEKINNIEQRITNVIEVQTQNFNECIEIQNNQFEQRCSKNHTEMDQIIEQQTRKFNQNIEHLNNDFEERRNKFQQQITKTMVQEACKLQEDRIQVVAQELQKFQEERNEVIKKEIENFKEERTVLIRQEKDKFQENVDQAIINEIFKFQEKKNEINFLIESCKEETSRTIENIDKVCVEQQEIIVTQSKLIHEQITKYTEIIEKESSNFEKEYSKIIRKQEDRIRQQNNVFQKQCEDFIASKEKIISQQITGHHQMMQEEIDRFGEKQLISLGKQERINANSMKTFTDALEEQDIIFKKQCEDFIIGNDKLVLQQVAKYQQNIEVELSSFREKQLTTLGRQEKINTDSMIAFNDILEQQRAEFQKQCGHFATTNDKIVSQKLIKIQQNIEDEMLSLKEKQVKNIAKQEQINNDVIKLFNTLYATQDKTFKDTTQQQTSIFQKQCDELIASKEKAITQQLLKIQQNASDEIVSFKEKQTKNIVKQEQINADAIKSFNTLYASHQATFNEISSTSSAKLTELLDSNKKILNDKIAEQTRHNDKYEQINADAIKSFNNLYTNHQKVFNEMHSENTKKLNEYCVKQNDLYENQILIYESQKTSLFEKMSEQTGVMFDYQKKLIQSKVAEITRYYDVQKKSSDATVKKINTHCEEQQTLFLKNIEQLVTKQHMMENSFVNLNKEVEIRKQMLIDEYNLNSRIIHEKHSRICDTMESQINKLESRYLTISKEYNESPPERKR